LLLRHLFVASKGRWQTGTIQVFDAILLHYKGGAPHKWVSVHVPPKGCIHADLILSCQMQNGVRRLAVENLSLCDQVLGHQQQARRIVAKLFDTILDFFRISNKADNLSFYAAASEHNAA